MKKSNFILLFIFFGLSTNSQNSSGWIDSLSIWNHTFWEFNWGNPTGYNQRYYVGDTLINDKTFQKVNGIRRKSVTYTPGITSWGSIYNLSSDYFYTHNDSVYLLQSNNSLQFLWALNPSAGDVWDMGLHPTSFGDTAMQSFVKVDSVTNYSINNQVLKKIYLKPCINANGDDFNLESLIVYPAWLVFQGGYVLEKIGLTTGWNFIGTFKSTDLIDEQIADNLSCFQSNTLSYNTIIDFESCFERIFTVGIENSIDEENEISITPNPADNFIKIEGLKLQNDFEIISIHGKVVFYGEVPHDKIIPIDNLINGIDFLKLYPKEKNIETVSKKIVIFNH